MTIRYLLNVRLRAGCVPVLALALASCSPQPVGESVHEQSAVAIAPQGASDSSDPKVQPVAAQPEPPKPDPSGPTFAFPPDLTGKGLARVVAPNVVGPLSGDH